MDNINSDLKLKKISNTIGKFEVYSPNSIENDIYFKIKKGKLIITRLKITPRTVEKPYYYLKDTLITVNNKINITELNNILIDKKNIRRH